MKELPVISAVIPVYNDASTIERAVTSVLVQTHSVAEIIIIDDGSEDDLAGALEKLPNASYRLLRNRGNKGPAAARNTGVKASSGEYVAFLDGDDAWRPEKIASQIAALSRCDKTVAACVTGFALHRSEPPKVEAYVPIPRLRLLDDLVWGCRFSPGSTLMVRRDCYDVVGYYDEAFRRLEDWDWLLRFSNSFAMTSVQSVMADVYLGASDGHHHLREVIEATARIRSKHLHRVSEAGLSRRQKFLSALNLEQSAACYRMGKIFQAITLTVKAVLTWPFQNQVFLIQVLRSFRKIIATQLFR